MAAFGPPFLIALKVCCWPVVRVYQNAGAWCNQCSEWQVSGHFQSFLDIVFICAFAPLREACVSLSSLCPLGNCSCVAYMDVGEGREQERKLYSTSYIHVVVWQSFFSFPGENPLTTVTAVPQGGINDINRLLIIKPDGLRVPCL